jgi:hypothetical protein
VFGCAIFVVDWSGLNRFDPCCHPKNLADIWWHFPLAVSVLFASLWLTATDPDDGPRGGL